jgi:hypothetical protein
MIQIWKVKRPGKKVQTYTCGQGPLHKNSLKRNEPELYALIKPGGPQAVSIGEKKKVQLQHRGKRPAFKGKKGWWVAVHWVHPREMSVSARKKVCGKGLMGEARRKFVEEGMTYAEQQHEAQPIVAARTAAAIQAYREDHPELYASRKRVQKERTEKRRKERGGIDYSQYYSPVHVAKAAKLTPAEVRKFLRKKKIGKRGGRYAFTKPEAQKIARAAKKYYAEEG